MLALICINTIAQPILFLEHSVFDEVTQQHVIYLPKMMLPSDLMVMLVYQKEAVGDLPAIPQNYKTVDVRWALAYDSQLITTPQS